MDMILTIAIFPLLALEAAAAPDDTWPRYGHDGALTGRTALRGDIVNPRVAWSISLAGERFELELLPGGEGNSLRLESGKPLDVLNRTLKIPGPVLLDLDGGGQLRPAVESYHERWAKILLETRGLQRVAWDQTWTTAKICHLELFAHDDGHDKPRRVWRSDPEDVVFSPLNIVHDIDGDGVQEICVALHYRVMIYEGTTGRKETELRFHSSRSYGWFGLADVDADGQMELIVLSDFQSHMDVLDVDRSKPEPERLRVLWRRDIERDIEKRRKWIQVGPRPLADVTGDGKPEIVVNLFNDTGDGEWHTVVIEGATGKVLADLPKRYTRGSADLDGDGAAEIFCGLTSGTFVPTRGTIELVSVRGGESSTIWSRTDAAFALANIPRMGRLWSTSAAMGMQHVLVTDRKSRPAFLVLEGREVKGKRTEELVAVRHDGKRGFKTLWRIRGLPRDIEAVAASDSDGGVSALLRMDLPHRGRATIEADRVRCAPVARSPLGTPPFSPIALRLEAGGPVMTAVEGAAGTIFAIRPPGSGEEKPSVLWQRRGRGMSDGSRLTGLVAADLDGDGGAEVVAADAKLSGQAVLVAHGKSGEVFWESVFPRTPGARPVWNVGALTFWWPGHYRSPGRLDMFISTRRGLMHSDLGHLVDGRTGRVIWTREKATAPGEFNWGYAGAVLAAADMTGDRCDELVNLYPVCFWKASGASGELLAARELASRKQLPAWAAYGEPIVFDLNGDGEKEVLLDSVYILALLDGKGRPIWHGKGRRDYLTGRPEDNVGETTNTKHALVDFDGDGRPEIASGGYGNGVRALDPRNGKILWSLDAPAPTCRKCAAANIDGAGGDEMIYTAGDTLLAITGSRTGGRVLWKWKGPGTLSLPAIADLDGDGRAEIAVQSADGTLHCLDGRGSN